MTKSTDESVVLRVAFHESAPWSYKDNKQMRGIKYDIIEAVSREMGVTMSVSFAPASRLLALLAAGQIDYMLSPVPIGYQIPKKDPVLIDGQPILKGVIGAFALKKNQLK